MKTTKTKIGVKLVLALVAAVAGGVVDQARAAETAPPESDYYQIVTLPIPKGITLEASALQLMPDGKLAVATRIGEIYMVEGAFANPPENVKFNLYASGLHEILGLTIRDGWLYCVQRCEVTRMKDTKGKGRADVFETIADPWGSTGIITSTRSARSSTRTATSGRCCA